MKSAFFIKRREALHFLRGLSSVFLPKSGGIFKKPDLKAAENKGWRIRETINILRRIHMIFSPYPDEREVINTIRRFRNEDYALL